MRRTVASALFAALAIFTAGCVIFHRVQVDQIIPRDTVAVTSPVKAHLKDGSTVVYANGVTVSGGTLRGAGVRYDLSLKRSQSKALALASGGAEYFSASIHAAVPLTSTERKKVDAAFARSRVAVEALLPGPSITALTASQLESLSAVWTSLWREIDSSVDSNARPSLQFVPTR